jgi:hypothetical protein
VKRIELFFFEDEAAWGLDPESTCILDNKLFYSAAPKVTNRGKNFAGETLDENAVNMGAL